MRSGEPLTWRCHTRLDKYDGDRHEVVEVDGNVLVIGGASALWQNLIGTGAVSPFNNANATIGVGDSVTAATDTQTDLQAGANKLRKALDASYPQHTDSVSVAGSKSVVFRATFAAADANFAWNEWGIFNASVAGRMLNRKQEALGTKPASATWVLTLTLSLS